MRGLGLLMMMLGYAGLFLFWCHVLRGLVAGKPICREPVVDYFWKWMGILSPLWLFLLLVLYAVVAGECTRGGYDPTQAYFMGGS